MKAIVAAICLFTSFVVSAHPGRTNSEGCHNNRKTGDYHCHGGGSSTRTSAPRAVYSAPKQIYCTSFRTQEEAQRYSDAHPEANLDRDGDGIACENLAGGSSGSSKPSKSSTTGATTYGVYSDSQPTSKDLSGRVVGISDGDTLTLLDSSNTQYKVRLNAIDAPESGQPFGQASKTALSDICYNTTATVKYVDTDRYGRTVGDVTCNGISANEGMVIRGLAWVYDKYATNYEYLYPMQESAKSSKLGLWADPNAIPPWDWRAGKRAPEAIDPDDANGVVIQNAVQGIFRSILFGR